MTGKTHRLVNGSGAFVVLTAAGLSTPVAAAGAGVAALAASWPDDVEDPLHLSHRGPSHRPVLQGAVLALPVVASAVWLPVVLLYVAALAAAAWLGCVLHSCADAMTVEKHGIQLLWPLSTRGYHLAPRFCRVRVGRNSRSEYAFVLAWCAFVLSYLYVRYHDQIAALGNHS